MGKVKKLLNELLLNIYGKSKQKKIRKSSRKRNLQRLNLKELFEIEATFQKHIIMIGLTLEEELIIRDRYTRSQKLLCKYVDAALHFFADNTHPPMRFSLTPPPAKSPHIVTSPTNKNNNNSGSDATKRYSTAKKSTSKTVRINLNNNMQAKSMSSDQRANVITTNSTADASIGGNDKAAVTSTDVHDDYIQWLHAMKLVARLPGGMPPEFRRKLWLTLAEKYLKSRNVDWEKEEKKCLSEEWREDDEELGVQIVKDLHRTGSNLCSGPAAKVNQAILKRVLLGYARYNPEVGYCQGFNMLGALILQVMDKEEVESMKVMIYLVEGILPPGYFCGSMGGLQADMGVFRDLMQCKLPRLAKHLEKLQGPVENAFEPPLTNVFTMQWFLTMFCTCLPMTCVLRVWDLVLIEGSDVLLRTALVLWSLLEERVLGTRSADDFYCKMGSFASELLNGHLIDSNSLIEKVVQLGPISDIEKLRNKHLYNITPTKHKSNIPLYLGDDESENDEDSRLAIATVWGIPWSRRGSQMTSNSKQVPTVENKDRIALDISLLKKQYDKLRERQKQAHIIITTACSTARQGTTSVSPSIMPVNQLLMGRTAIITNQGRRIAPPTGAIPPARKPSLPTILQSKPVEKKQLRRGETLHWRDTDLSKRRRDSLTWKEIKADRASLTQDELTAELKSQKLNSRFGKSDSSSYSEESEEEDNGSSTDTSLCDDDPASTGDKTHSSSIENSPKRRLKSARRNKASENKFLSSNQLSAETYKERTRPKSWAPSTSEIPFVLLTSESPTKAAVENVRSTCDDDINEENKISRDRDRHALKKVSNTEWVIPNFGYSPIAGDLATTTLEPLNIQTDIIELPIITSTSQLSPMPDITSFLKDTTISPLPTPKPSLLDSTNSLGSCDGDGAKKFDVSDDGVTNQYFERVNSVERPTKLDLYYSLNDDDNIGGNFEMEAEDSKTQYTKVEPKNVFKDNQRPDLLIDHPQHLEADNANININDLRIASEREEANQLLLKLIGERDDNIPGENLDDFREQTYTETHSPKIEPTEPQLKSTNSSDMSRASQKRRDPRRLTLTRSTTMDIEERFQALEKHFDKEKSTQSFENPQNDELSSKHDVNRHEAKENIHCSELNRLSSTENLNKENIHAPLKDNITTISSKPEIPSTTDLEERYERQMSVSDKTEKDLVDLPRNSRTNDDINDKKNARKESIEREIKDNEVKKDSKIATEKENESTESDNSKKSRPSPKRMPSTAELEERFDALEIKTKAEKISPTKNKKEPPDIKTETKKTPSEVEDVDRVSQEVNKKEDRKITQESSKMEAQKEEGVKVEATKKKTPPSTAELEKRFHALEKQMSTSTLTHDTREKVESTHSKTTIKSRQSSEEKENSDTFREALKEENTTSKAPLDKNETDTEKDSTERNESTKGKLSGRRASEPPSTEDLERRYESLKRRMSTRIFTENTAGKSETIDEALQRIEKKVMGESDYKDERTQNTAVSSTASHSTEFKEEKEHIETQKLEGEPIKKKSTSDNLTKETSPIKSNNQKELPSKTKPEENDSINMEPAERSVEQHIPDAPPLPAKSPIEKTLPNVVVSKEHQSLIEELQSKIDLNSDEETLKPSSINPNRKPPLTQQKQLSLKNDETSETHALNAFLQSENFEPWHGYTPKMVRRFSDLPSRADLENRLEFLEQKFYKKLYKQRCASDSEVASRKHFIDKRPNYEAPSTSASTQLEQRLQALEKQLSENSLKLLEAMRAKTQDIVIESESPRRLSTDTIDATGKELVRYTHVGELEESGILKPINISINIKMTLDKNAETKPNEKEIISSNDLERRLEALEEQLKVSQKAKIDAENDLKICKQELKTAELLDEKQSDKPKIDSDVQKVDQTAKTTGSANNDESAETGKMVLKKPKSIEQQENLMDKNNSKSEINQKEEITACKEETAESEKNNFKNQNEVEKVENQTKTRQSQKEGACPKEVPSHKEGPSHKEELKANQKETESKKSVINEKTSTDQKENPTKEKCSKCESNRKELLTSKKEITESQKTDSSKEKIAEKTENKDEKIKASQKKVSGLAGDTKLIEKPLKKPEILKTLDDEQSCPKPEAEKTLEKKNTSQKSKDESTSADRPKDNQVPQSSESELLAEELANSASGIGSADPNKKTLVLLLNNEPKAVKVRRLTRANTEELEGLFQALEKQLHERNLVKSDDGKLMHMDDKNETKSATVEAKAISELTKEIEEFTHAEKSQVKKSIVKEEQPYDWGTDPIKRHLKRKTAHLPSTKELEARFRSLERQIKLLEDVENIDVEQRLHEIERKIKLQYSLAHETDLTKYLELCEGKGLDDEPLGLPSTKTEEVRCECGRRTPSKGTPKTSPGCTTIHKSSHSPTRKATTTPGTPPASAFNKETDKGLKDRSTYKAKNTDQKKQPIHPLEMLLDPSPDDSKIPTTGELEHRIRMLDEKRRSPTPTGKSRSKSRSKSPARDSVSKRTPSEERYTKQPLYAYSKYDDMRPSPPTAEELEARMRALEEDHVFDPKTQRNFKEFNEKLKNVISPSVSFEEYRIEQTREVSPRRSTDPYRSPTSKSALRSSDNDFIQPRSTSPKVLRFSEDEDRHSSSRPYKEFVEQRRPVGTSYGVLNTIEENSKILHRILKKTIAEPKDGRTDTYGATMASFTSEGLDAMGSRLMRETSPLRRTGTHTGVPLKTDDNINERLSSIKDTIKSIDSLCEEKPYRKEKCQRYIDSLFSDSVHFAQKKTSLEDLRSRSASRTRISDYTPSIHVSDLSQRPSEYYLSRSIGSAESIRTTSPLRAASPLHYRSNRDLSRNTDVSPGRRGRRYDEEREEYESRVRRDYMLPNLFLDNHSNIRGSGSSLTKFYKVDSQLEPYERDISRSHTPSRSPVRSSYELRDTMTLHNNSYTAPNTQGKSFDFDKPISPYRQTTHNMLASDYAKRLNTPVYSPSKLEIRHTTVTSTFYDRLLTEKQLEKSSRPPSRSPVHAGPSIADKSYMDTTTKAGNNSNDSLKVSNNFSSSLNSTLTAQTTTLHHNTNTTTTGNSDSYHSLSPNLICASSRNSASHNDLRIRSCDNIIMKLNSTSVTSAAFTGSIGLTTSTVTTGTTLSMTPFSINSTQSYLNNTNQTTSAATSTTTYTISENNPIGSNNSRSYINLLSSSNLSTSPAVITTSYSSFLPSITDKITSALTSSTASSAITVPFIANSSVPTLSSYPSTSTTVASYPLMSATFQPSIYGSNTLGLFSSTLGKSDSNITSEFKN